MTVETTTHTAILGAGITGLCVAHSLRLAGQPFHLLESSDRVGGALQSTLHEGYLAEHGPNSLLIKDRRILTLLDEAGLSQGDEIINAHDEAKKRYIVQRGQLHALPASLPELLRSPLFSRWGKLRLAREPFIGKYKGEGEESFAGFVRRRLGSEVLASAAGPFVSGIYAGDPESLSVRHAFPRLWNLEKEHGSLVLGALALQFRKGDSTRNPHRHAPARMVSFRSGMHALPRAIADQLPDKSLKLQCSVTNIERSSSGWSLSWTDASGQAHTGQYRQLVIAIPHHRLATLPLPPQLIDQLRPVSELHAPPVTSVVLGFKREHVNHALDGFGMLIKREENSPLLGVLFSSSMFNGRAPDGHITLTCMMGGSLHPEYADNQDNIVLAELNKLLGITGTQSYYHRTSWQHAIPQYDLGYQSAINALELCDNNHPGLHLAGNYRGGISMADCIINGLKLGNKIAFTGGEPA